MQLTIFKDFRPGRTWTAGIVSLALSAYAPSACAENASAILQKHYSHATLIHDLRLEGRETIRKHPLDEALSEQDYNLLVAKKTAEVKSRDQKSTGEIAEAIARAKVDLMLKERISEYRFEAVMAGPLRSALFTDARARTIGSSSREMGDLVAGPDTMYATGLSASYELILRTANEEASRLNIRTDDSRANYIYNLGTFTGVAGLDGRDSSGVRDGAILPAGLTAAFPDIVILHQEANEVQVRSNLGSGMFEIITFLPHRGYQLKSRERYQKGRDETRLLQFAAYFDDYTEENGIWFPRRYTLHQ